MSGARVGALVVAVLAVSSVLGAGRAHAGDGLLDGIAPDLELYTVANVDPLGRDAFGWGGGAAAHVDVLLVGPLALHAGAAMFVLPPEAQPSTVWWFGSRAGLRLHWSVLLGLGGDGWLDVHHELGRSGQVVRQGMDAGIGYTLGVEDVILVGPFVRFLFADDPAVNDPMLLLAGVTLSFGDDARYLPSDAPDLDRDGVPDAVDPCPEEQEGRHPHPERRGCPAPDSDEDGIVDHLDVCTHESMWPHPDEDDERTGCPSPDRDGDGVPDAWDTCPDEHAPNGGDPFAEGCIEDPY